MPERCFDFCCLTLLALVLSGCRADVPSPASDAEEGLVLPDGFEATVVADSIGPARHLAVRDNGDVYATLRRSYDDGSIVALRDTTGDGRADVIRKFGVFTDDVGSYYTGAQIHDGALHMSTNLNVYRYDLAPGQLVPEQAPDTLVVDDHAHGSHEHITKPLAFDDAGNLYVPFGAPNNACQEPKRTPGAPGLRPCPSLEDHGGVWRFDKDEKNQTQADAEKFATGVRSVVAMDWNPADEQLYLVMHGRDDLHRLWPNTFSRWENALLPAEEFVRVTEGANFGWPYCYYDQLRGQKVLAPEYGGDGQSVGQCDQYDDPVIGFPGHFAPNDLLFYHAEQFPSHYRGGAFVAFHGSTIREPYPQAGYFVGFVPREDGAFSDDWEVFANGFAGIDTVVNTSDAAHRPGGLAVGPGGALYITEDNDGKIWRVAYTGDQEHFGQEALAGVMQEKRTASNIRTPPRSSGRPARQGQRAAGEGIYAKYCAACHQGDGGGAAPRYPPLAGSEWVTGSKERLVSLIVDGLEGPIEVKGERYNNVMPQHSFLSPEEVAEVATYVRQHFGNDASAVSADEVRAVTSEQTPGSTNDPRP